MIDKSIVVNMIGEAESIGRGKRRCKDLVCAFDIETTNLPSLQHSVMYLWQFACEQNAVIGRTWEEFVDFINMIDSVVNTKLIVFIHNAAFEFSFLKGILDFRKDDVFIVDGRRVLYFRYKHIEFRCSYLQTNRDLESLLDFYKVKHPKLILDYKKERFSDTPLTEAEIQYGLNDVLGLVEAIHARLREYGDTLSSLPYTSTGYCRRECRDVFKESNMIRLHGNYEIYKVLRACFRGGNTHANRFNTGCILDGVVSYDRSSSYPDVLVNCKYPMTPFTALFDLTYKGVLNAINMGYAVIGRYRLHNIKMRDEFYGCPYISKSKTISPAYSKDNVNGRYGTVKIDNGRILSVDETFIDIALTDIDLKIVLDQYAIGEKDFEVLEAYISRYAYLPTRFRKLVIEYYERKTKLKPPKLSDEDKARMTEEDWKKYDTMVMDYTKAKNLLNALYGMFAQDPARVSMVYDPDTKGIDYDPETFDKYTYRRIDQALQEQYREFISKSVMPYQIGVYCTAWARLRLEEGIRLIPDDDFVYTDTDSIKFISRGTDPFVEYNKRRIADSTESGAYAVDAYGETHYMGVFELETKTPIQFKTLGAKKYVVFENGKYEITISGVSKKWGAKELTEKGGFDAFNLNTVFDRIYTDEDGREHCSAGLDVKYNDNVDFDVNYHGHQLRITDNAYLFNSAYHMGIAEDYKYLLLNLPKLAIHLDNDLFL